MQKCIPLDMELLIGCQQVRDRGAPQDRAHAEAGRQADGGEGVGEPECLDHESEDEAEDDPEAEVEEQDEG